MALGVTAATDWSNKLLANVTTGTTKVTNEVFFWPDESNAGRVMSVGGSTVAGSIGSYLFQTGGPSTWTAGNLAGNVPTTGGEFFPTGATSGMLFNVSGDSLVVTTFVSGVHTNATIDTNVTQAYSFSCMTDVQGNVHVAYGFTADSTYYIGYAQKAAGGGWTVFARSLGSNPVTGTAVVATSLTTAKVYLTYGFSPSCALASTAISGSTLALPTTVDGGGTGPLATIGTGSPTHLYYCRLADTSGASYFIRDLSTTTATASTIGTLPAASPIVRDMRAALAPDGAIRIAIYVANTGVIYYMKVADASFGKVVDLSGTLTYADLRGFMFDANGTPLVLYRKSLTESYVAYPSDIDDVDGNGRVDLLDTAFRGGYPSVPPLSENTVANSAGFFKVQFPVVGSPTGSNTAVLKNAGQNLMYSVETSPDLLNWTTISTGVKFTLIGTGTAKSAVGVFSDVVQSATAPKFFRVIASRITNNF